MASFKITRSKWRCGGDSQVRGRKLGKGNTQLLNEQGYMCCLGQVARQCGIGSKAILNVATPTDVSVKRLPHLIYKVKHIVYRDNSELAQDAMEINDNEGTTVARKEKLLIALFKKHGHKLTFVD